MCETEAGGGLICKSYKEAKCDVKEPNATLVGEGQFGGEFHNRNIRDTDRTEYKRRSVGR